MCDFYISQKKQIFLGNICRNLLIFRELCWRIQKNAIVSIKFSLKLRAKNSFF